MNSGEMSPLIAWWGAGLSTLLAIVKLWELWRDRFRLEIGYSFAGDETVGNSILIRNLSSRPLILSYWEVLYCSGRWPLRKFQDIACAEHDSGDRRIEPHSTLELHFAESDYFSWGHKALKGRRIYIRLFVAGRRPILKLVYPS
jgi:hypothetical protein